MKGIIVAAGMGSRLMPLTQDRPKCMLPVKEKPLIEWTIDNMKSVGCDEIIVIDGYKKEALFCDNVIRITNVDYMNNNILHSFMCAKEYMNEAIIVSYSDIWVEPEVYKRLLDTPGDFVISVDEDWKGYYNNRNEHPLDEAENVLYENKIVTRIGKHINNKELSSQLGEFLGLWYMSEKGSKIFCDVFNKLNDNLLPDDKFQQAKRWHSSYITDLFQELVDSGHEINCATIEKSWAEIDTTEDYNRLLEIAHEQHLWTLCDK